MIAWKRAAACLLTACLGFATLPAGAAGAVAGNWSITPADSGGKVDLLMNDGHSTSASDWQIEDLKGLDPAPTRHDVHFTIERDAGRIDATGTLADGSGAGTFRFAPAPGYADALGKLGLGRIGEDDQFALALHDVSLDFAREMATAGIDGLAADTLLAFRIHGVDLAYVKDLRAAGAHADEAETLIAFAIHRVTPDLVRALHQVRPAPDDEKIVALRIQGATPDWITELARLGYDHATAEELIAFRIHGVTPDFIGALQPLGYSHPAPEQLIAMRIHGVTPEYVAGLEAHGMKDLTVDQLVAMRIQGID